MQMNTVAALAELCVCSRPFTSCFEVLIKAFIAGFVLNIEVNHDMVFWNFDIMKPGSIEISKHCSDIIPLFVRSSFRATVLSRTFSALLVKYRIIFAKLNPILLVFWLFFLLDLELLCLKPTIIILNNRAIVRSSGFSEVPKIVFKFFFKRSLREWIWHFCIFAVYLIHIPSSFKRGSVLLLKNMIGVNNKVVEIVRGSHHQSRNIVIIVTRIF